MPTGSKSEDTIYLTPGCAAHTKPPLEAYSSSLGLCTCHSHFMDHIKY